MYSTPTYLLRNCNKHITLWQVMNCSQWECIKHNILLRKEGMTMCCVPKVSPLFQVQTVDKVAFNHNHNNMSSKTIFPSFCAYKAHSILRHAHGMAIMSGDVCIMESYRKVNRMVASLHNYTHWHIYMRMCVCVCIYVYVCVCYFARWEYSFNSSVWYCESFVTDLGFFSPLGFAIQNADR